MAKTSIEHRRKIRAMEAKRDELMKRQQKTREELSKSRAELKAARKSTAR